MQNAIRLSIVAALVLVAAPSASSGAADPEIVKGTSFFEGHGAATRIGPRRLFAWSNEIERSESSFAAFVEVNGGALRRVNARRTSAYVGGFDPGTDRVIYQQVRRGESDLFLYDVSQRSRIALRELNDGHWQWNPSIDTRRRTTWVVYGVNRFGSPAARWRFYLYNAETGERTLLDETSNRCGCLFPGTIAYPWVTWSVGEDATAWRYDIRSGERAPLMPTDRDEYGATVTHEGVAYVAQAGDRCGTGAKLYRVGLDGVPFLLHKFGDGREGANLSVDFTGAHDRLYFDRRNCRTGSSDVLLQRRAQETGEPAAPSRGSGGLSPGPRRSASSPDASPRTR